ncbi:unnamed protein product [Protopolystoma xenopodis]|uniref:Uncharacterized protein n=1 Tax=Protopolystoma xenopodis TaxID=117903 RepID=A0A3S5A9Y2_9PLAT|nr:unnamed protein product [Protopolystoma xenopodis]
MAICVNDVIACLLDLDAGCAQWTCNGHPIGRSVRLRFTGGLITSLASTSVSCVSSNTGTAGIGITSASAYPSAGNVGCSAAIDTIASNSCTALSFSGHQAGSLRSGTSTLHSLARSSRAGLGISYSSNGHICGVASASGLSEMAAVTAVNCAAMPSATAQTTETMPPLTPGSLTLPANLTALFPALALRNIVVEINFGGGPRRMLASPGVSRFFYWLIFSILNG